MSGSQRPLIRLSSRISLSLARQGVGDLPRHWFVSFPPSTSIPAEQVSIWQSTVTKLSGLGHSSPHAEQRADHNWISASGLITSVDRDQGCSAGPPMRGAGQIASTNQKLSGFPKKKLSLSLFRSLTNANTYFNITYRRLQSEQPRM